MIKRKAEKYEDHIEDIAYKLALSMVSQNAANAKEKHSNSENFNFEEQVKRINISVIRVILWHSSCSPTL